MNAMSGLSCDRSEGTHFVLVRGLRSWGQGGKLYGK
jgi:hypothetical protein